MIHTYPKHHFVKTGNLSNCQVCNNSDLPVVLDLGHQPLCDTLLTEKSLNQPEITYPLRIVWCKKCTAVGLDYCVDKKAVFHPNYPYLNSISKPLVDYQKAIAKSLVERYKLNNKNLVIDIGSADGTLLLGFKEQGIKVLGIEPTNTAKIANKNGVKTIQSFFDIPLSKKIKTKYGTAKVITTTNVFAHMQTIGEFIIGIHNLLDKDGIFISETHYLLDIIKDNQFDTIYHEHLRFYSLKSLIKLFEPYDFTVIHAERGSRYGGNLRIHVARGKGKKVNPSVSNLLKLEEKEGLQNLETYKKFAIRVKKGRVEFLNFLMKLIKSGKSIVGKSCPGRASTLLNYYGIDKDILPYLAELPTSLKLGMYLAGKHIPVIDEKILFDKQPDYVVLLAWHYAEFIMKRLKEKGLRSDFVIPLPKLKIIKNSEVKL